MHADQGMHTFTYALQVWNGSFADCDVVRQGYELNAPLIIQPGDAGVRSLFIVDAPNILIESVKPAEDGSSDVVVRLYEAMRMTTECTLTTTLPVVGATLTDMLERETVAEPGCAGGAIVLAFRPFEVKTLRLRL